MSKIADNIGEKMDLDANKAKMKKEQMQKDIAEIEEQIIKLGSEGKRLEFSKSQAE
jgi:hypothetical protein